MKKQLSVYVASPLGFSEAGKFFYYEKLIPLIQEIDFCVLDPWVLTDKNIILSAQFAYGDLQKALWQKADIVIGANNRDAIRKSDIVIAVLDGPDVDSGMASEVGFAAGIGEPIEGYRNDFRLSSDNIGSIVNLQVEFFIKDSGGEIAMSLVQLLSRLKSRYLSLSNGCA